MGMAAFFIPVNTATLEQRQRDPESAEDILFGDGNDPSGGFDVDKAWHGLHYLLTGTSEGGEPPLKWVRDADIALDYVMAHFPPLVQFHADAAARGDAVVAYMG